MDSIGLQVKLHRIDGLKSKPVRLSVRLHFRNQNVHSSHFDTHGSPSINFDQELLLHVPNSQPLDVNDQLSIEVVKHATNVLGIKKVYGHWKQSLAELQTRSSLGVNVELLDLFNHPNQVQLQFSILKLEAEKQPATSDQTVVELEPEAFLSSSSSLSPPPPSNIEEVTHDDQKQNTEEKSEQDPIAAETNETHEQEKSAGEEQHLDDNGNLVEPVIATTTTTIDTADPPPVHKETADASMDKLLERSRELEKLEKVKLDQLMDELDELQELEKVVVGSVPSEQSEHSRSANASAEQAALKSNAENEENVEPIESIYNEEKVQSEPLSDEQHIDSNVEPQSIAVIETVSEHQEIEQADQPPLQAISPETAIHVQAQIEPQPTESDALSNESASHQNPIRRALSSLTLSRTKRSDSILSRKKALPGSALNYGSIGSSDSVALQIEPIAESIEPHANQEEHHQNILRNKESNKDHIESICSPVLIDRSHREQNLLLETEVLQTQNYQLNVSVFEAAELCCSAMDIYVQLQLEDHQKHTRSKEGSSEPFFNEYFTFDLQLAPTQLSSQVLVIKAMGARKLKSDKVIGECRVDLATIWKEVNHAFLEKWAPLIDLEDATSGLCRGYIKVSLALMGAGSGVTSLVGSMQPGLLLSGLQLKEKLKGLKEPEKKESKDSPPAVQTADTHELHQERQLLVPSLNHQNHSGHVTSGGTSERSVMQLVVSVYRADGLMANSNGPAEEPSHTPTTVKPATGLLSKMRRIGQSSTTLTTSGTTSGQTTTANASQTIAASPLNAYVKVVYAGRDVSTSIKKRTTAPVWNEAACFVDWFPFLCGQVRLELRDSHSDQLLGVRCLQLEQLQALDELLLGGEHEGEPGQDNELQSSQFDSEQSLLPSFGPAFLHFYSPALMNNSDAALVQQGVMNGSLYQGRVLLSVHCEPVDLFSTDSQPHPVAYTKPLRPLRPQARPPALRSFTSFACIYGSERINNRFEGKQISYELTVGNPQSVQLDEQTIAQGREGEGETDADMSLDDNADRMSLMSVKTTITSTATTALDRTLSFEGIRSHAISNGYKVQEGSNKSYYLQLFNEKPCLYVHSQWPDYQQRDHLLNVLDRIVDNLQLGLEDVESLQQQEHSQLPARVRGVMEELLMGCNRYLALSFAPTSTSSQNTNNGSSGRVAGQSRLERQRRLCGRLQLRQLSQHLMQELRLDEHQFNVHRSVEHLERHLRSLQRLAQHPEDSSADLVLWMLVNGKRSGFVRLPTRQYLHSDLSDQAGLWSLRMHLLQMRTANRNPYEPSNALQMAIFHAPSELALSAFVRLPGLPKQLVDTMNESPAKSIQQLPMALELAGPPLQFEFRVHLYQARALPSADSNGLADPFVRVHLAGHCLQSEVINATLNPIWDQQLLVRPLHIAMDLQALRANPPVITMEVLDSDLLGKEEFLGRCFALPDLLCCIGEQRQPPKLRWLSLNRGQEFAGQVLVAFELLQLDESGHNTWDQEEEKQHLELSGEQPESGTILQIPWEIRPKMAIYRLQVLFWGVRELRRSSNLQTVDRPRVEIECGNQMISSNMIRAYKKHSNFAAIVRQLDVRLPEQSLYCPPLAIRVLDCKSFGRSSLLGSHQAPLLTRFMDRKARSLSQIASEPQQLNIIPQEHMYSGIMDTVVDNSRTIKTSSGTVPAPVEGFTTPSGNKSEDDHLEIDWWTRYFASRQVMTASSKRNSQHSSHHSTISTFDMSIISPDGQVIPSHLLLDLLPGPLEQSDLFTRPIWMDEFQISRGKQQLGPKRSKSHSLFGDHHHEESKPCGRFLGCVNIQKLPLVDTSLMDSIPKNDPVRFLIRVYIIRANDLQPSDALTGKADPFVTLQLSSGKKITDKSNYIPNQLNPIFGRCFELAGSLPLDSTLTIQVKDYDLIGKNELIGETKIDLEARYYSSSGSLIGLPKAYLTSGPGKWRLMDKPQTMLAKLCKQHRLTLSVQHNHIRIGEVMFTFRSEPSGIQSGNERTGNGMSKLVRKWSSTMLLQTEHSTVQIGQTTTVRPLGRQQMCLAVLNHWKEAFGYRLSSEHVECRPLYHPEHPGIPQGTLELFVELIPTEAAVPRHCTALDVSPRRPISYELRVVILNTEDIPLDEVNPITNEASSDIYVKGWLQEPDSAQSTDVHYRSLTGEGNFNWRFVFPFEYSANEQCLVVQRKDGLFSLDESEQKLPAKLQLQVWDADFCSPDDFLGSLTLDLNRFPRPAKSAAACDLRVIGVDSIDGHVTNTGGTKRPPANASIPYQTLSMFKQKRVKGWWPFTFKDPQTGQLKSAGKLEAEFHLVTKEESEKNPVGLARNEPEALEKPNRPDTSFTWFLSPWKTFRYVVWRNFKLQIIKLTVIAFLALFLVLFVYSLPGYTANKLINSL